MVFLSLLCAFVLIQLLIVWQMGLILTADTGVTDVKTSPFGQMCNDLGVLQFNGESDSKTKTIG